MAKIEKLYENIKNNPKDVAFKEIKKLLIYAGYEVCEGKGSHMYFKHPNADSTQDNISIPYKKPIKEIYIKKALRLIENTGCFNDSE